MRRTALLLAVGMLALATSAGAQTVTYHLRKSGSPVPVPGGTTTLVLDTTAPGAGTPAVESASVPKTTTATVGTFTAQTFGSPATLGLGFTVLVHLSANLSMNGCAEVAAVVEHVDTAGTHSPVASGLVLTTISQGGNGGTTGFVPVAVTLAQDCAGPTEDVTVDTGESIAVRVSVANRCNANRTVSLAYDAAGAPGAITFAPLPPPDPVFRRNCFAKCQLTTSKAAAKFWLYKSKCVLKCQVSARKGLIPFNDCFPPYAGATLACIVDPLRGVEAKMQQSIAKACVPAGRCPNCYADGDCNTYSMDAVQTSEGQLDSFVPGLYCENTTDKAIAKCQDGNTKALVKLYGATGKCYDKCFAAERKLITPAGSCDPPASYPITNECLSTAQTKAIQSINKACFNPPAVAPACWGAITAAQWANLMQIVQDNTIVDFYCFE